MKVKRWNSNHFSPMNARCCHGRNRPRIKIYFPKLAYDPEGQITNWTQQVDAASPTAFAYQYDAGKQLLSAVLNSTGAGATVLKQYAYGYDLAGNRTSEQIGAGANGPVAISRSGYNNANQVTNRVGGSGALLFAGYLDKQGTVTVSTNAAVVNHYTTNFYGYTSVTNGTNVVPVIATDYNNNSRTNKYQLVVTNNGVALTISYDLNGNETSVVSATATNSYQWDAANRLVSITSPTNQSLFAYDGLGRRVQIIEKTNGVAYATNKFVWDGQALAEQRDMTGGTVVKRFFGQGEQISGVNYYFTRDHLGSIREMTDGSGTIQARYDYDPYGRRVKISGSLEADFGYTGDYYHAASGLWLTLYRAYSADLGRWLSRDPLAEQAGLNLYAYCGNNPINAVDPLGRDIGIYGGGTGDQNNPFMYVIPPTPPSNNPCPGPPPLYGGTFQIGISVSGYLGPVHGHLNVGIAVDTHGHVGIYDTFTPPLTAYGVGAGASGAVSFAASNGGSINDLGGPFAFGTGSLGAGLDGSIDGFGGQGSQNQPIVGGGFSVGLGGGGGAATGINQTYIHQLW